MRRKRLKVLEDYVNRRFNDVERALHLVHHTTQQIEMTYLAALRTIELDLEKRVELVTGNYVDVKDDFHRVSETLETLTQDMTSSVQNLHSEVLAFEARIKAHTENRLTSLTTDLSAHTNTVLSQFRQNVLENLEMFAKEISALGVEMRVSHDDLRILAQTTTLTFPRQELAADNFALANTVDSAFYAALERRFRGSDNELLDRFSDYEDVFENLPKNSEPFVDLGCGRGEFLRFLRDLGINGIGVDNDPSAIDRCVRSDLNVRQESLLTFLQSAGDDSASGISLIHVIEHFSVDVALTILRQCRRVIRPSGILIIETPNPKNLRVGSANFWLDPTHIRPYPPELLSFMVEYVGFGSATTRFFRGNEKIYTNDLSDTGGKHALDAMISAVDGPLDYAVIGRVTEAS